MPKGQKPAKPRIYWDRDILPYAEKDIQINMRTPKEQRIKERDAVTKRFKSLKENGGFTKA